ncbi:MAG: hypothetical protein K9N51_10450 [Candidatus Pacebacteria bacterium]|nr:hypothetical protein [Candidatus Paceibacterota bacterium]
MDVIVDGILVGLLLYVFLVVVMGSVLLVQALRPNGHRQISEESAPEIQQNT